MDWNTIEKLTKRAFSEEHFRKKNLPKSENEKVDAHVSN
jgi:hypothetical protein